MGKSYYHKNYYAMKGNLYKKQKSVSVIKKSENVNVGPFLEMEKSVTQP